MTVCADLNLNLNLRKFARMTYDIEFNPKKFSGAILRFRKPYSTCVVFSNGKINCVGCSNLNDANKAIRLCAKKLKNAGFNVLVSNIHVVNYAGAASLWQNLNLDKLSMFLGKNARYDPELFCGLILTLPSCKVTIHNSGKIIITGSKYINDLKISLNWLVDKVFELELSGLN